MQLNYYGFKISIETNGTMDVEPFFNWVESFVVDYKIQYPQKMFRKNFLILRPTDIIKIVVYTIQEAEHMLPLISEWQGYDTKAIIAFSPVHGFLEPSTLAEFLMAHDIPNCAISLQIHKIIGLK
jgi:7-carboxy-7-deazaguanine synthase